VDAIGAVGKRTRQVYHINAVSCGKKWTKTEESKDEGPNLAIESTFLMKM